VLSYDGVELDKDSGTHTSAGWMKIDYHESSEITYQQEEDTWAGQQKDEETAGSPPHRGPNNCSGWEVVQVSWAYIRPSKYVCVLYKAIKQHLSKVVHQPQNKDWEEHIPLFLMAFRAAAHNSTGQSPSRVLFNQLFCDVVFGSPTAQRHWGLRWRVARLLDIHELVRESLNVAGDKMKARYDLKASSGEFHKDNTIWLFNPQRKKGKLRKLTSYLLCSLEFFKETPVLTCKY